MFYLYPTARQRAKFRKTRKISGFFCSMRVSISPQRSFRQNSVGNSAKGLGEFA
jgi:hypothetical protein